MSKKKTKAAPPKESPVPKTKNRKSLAEGAEVRLKFCGITKLIKLPILKSFMELVSFIKDIFDILGSFRIFYHNTTSNMHVPLNNWEYFQTVLKNGQKRHCLQVSTKAKEGFPLLNLKAELQRENIKNTQVAHKSSSTLPKETVQNQLSLEKLKKATVPPLSRSNQNLQLLKSPKETILPSPPQKESRKTAPLTLETKQLQMKSTHPLPEEPIQTPSKKSKPTQQFSVTNLSSAHPPSKKARPSLSLGSNLNIGTSNKKVKQIANPYNSKTSLPTSQETPNPLSSSTHSARKNPSRSLAQVSIPKPVEHSSTHRNIPSTNTYHSSSASSTTDPTTCSATSSASSSSSDTNQEQSSSSTPHPSPSRASILEPYRLLAHQPQHFSFTEHYQLPYTHFSQHPLPSVCQDPRYMSFPARQNVGFHQGYSHPPYSHPYYPHPFAPTLGPYRDPAQLLSYFDNSEAMTNIAPSVHSLSSIPPSYPYTNGEANLPFLNHPTVTLPIYSLPPPTLSEPTRTTAAAEPVRFLTNNPSEIFTGSVKLSASKSTDATKEPNRLPARAPSTDQYNQKGSSVLAIVEKYQDSLSNHSSLDILSELLLDQILDGAQVNLTLLERSLQRFKIISQSNTTIINSSQPDSTPSSLLAPSSRQYDFLDLTED